MSDTSAFGFGKFVPGFDFLQNLSQTASKTAPAAGAIPGMPSWVAPTLNVEEIDKRIQELKAVQFWLEQNGTALKATIQALEVQKMTLTTLQGMNVNMADLAKAFTASVPSMQPAPDAADAPETPAAASASEPSPEPTAKAPAVDPMQWWGALTQQFQNIAASALKDVASQALKDVPAQAKDSPKKANKTATKATSSSASAARKRTSAKAVKAPARQRG